MRPCACPPAISPYSSLILLCPFRVTFLAHEPRPHIRANVPPKPLRNLPARLPPRKRNNQLIKRQRCLSLLHGRHRRDRKRNPLLFRLVEGFRAWSLAGNLKIPHLIGQSIRRKRRRPVGHLKVKMRRNRVAAVSDQPEQP